MSKARMILGITVFLAIVAIPASLSGCATTGARTGEPAPIESVADLSSVRSDKVIIKTETLRALLKNQKARDEKCRDLHNQLKGLKDLDLSETDGVL